MKRVIKVSQAWIAALFLGLVLTGCGGGSSGSSDSGVGTGDSTGTDSGVSEGTPPSSGSSGTDDGSDESEETPPSSGSSGTDDGSDGSEETPPSSGSGEEVVDRSASLSWSAPTDRENGEDLSPYDLERYVISYGTDRDNLDNQVEVDNVGGLQTMTYDVENLSAGTWYFTIQVEDVDGLISAPSAPVSKTI